MKRLILCMLVFILTGRSYAQIRPTSIAKPTNPNKLVNIKQRNLEAEQQAFAKRSNTDEAWFYENANYGGRKFVLERGSYTLKGLGLDLNDFLGSALVPSNLIVVVYTNDNFEGDWYILKPDNSANLNFENAMIAKANVAGRLLSGKVDINDVVSSIMVYNPEQDYAKIAFDDIRVSNETFLNPKDFDEKKSYRAFPGPYLNGLDGHNMADLGIMNDRIETIRLNNNRISIQIHQEANFKAYACVLKREFRDYSIINLRTDDQILPNISLTDCGTITATIGKDISWSKRVSSFKVSIAPGMLTEINK